ncbi:MAG: SxtJ family membrane protein [Polyangiales bacterium]|jgi:hypothetical protein
MSRLVEIDFNPDTKTLRQFGVIAFVGFGALAALAYYEKLVFAFGLGDARLAVAASLAALGLLALVLGLVAPRANRVLYVGLSLLAFPIGFVLSYVIMGALYFLIIGPIAIALRLAGRDPMRRARDPQAGSYWTPARPARDKESYFHQY